MECKKKTASNRRLENLPIHIPRWTYRRHLSSRFFFLSFLFLFKWIVLFDNNIIGIKLIYFLILFYSLGINKCLFCRFILIHFIGSILLKQLFWLFLMLSFLSMIMALPR